MTTTNFAASAAEWTTSELQAELQRPSVRKPRGRIQKEWRAAVDAELAKRS